MRLLVPQPEIWTSLILLNAKAQCSNKEEGSKIALQGIDGTI